MRKNKKKTITSNAASPSHSQYPEKLKIISRFIQMRLVKKAIEKFKALSHFLRIRKLADIHFILLNDQKPKEQKYDFKERSYFAQRLSQIFGINFNW